MVLLAHCTNLLYVCSPCVGPNELYKDGMLPLKFGLAWVKGIEISQRLYATIATQTSQAWHFSYV